MSTRGAVRVRQAVFGDLDTLALLFDAYRRFQGQAGDVDAARAFLRARMDHGDAVLFVAHDGPQPAGLAQLYPSYSSVALARVFVLNDLFVAEAHRQRGIASALLDAVERHAVALGAVRLSLNVARGNSAAMALYAARGWAADTHFLAYHRALPPPPAS